MRRWSQVRLLPALLAPALAVPLGLVALTAPATSAAPTAVADQAAATPYTKTTLHFAVTVGADRDQSCDIVGDVYVPASASRRNRVPAILTTNGFGGSKDDQAGIGDAFAREGYVVLSYSGLGFGGSTCKITLDDPDVDGVAGSQLLRYLGGAEGIAFTDAEHTTPAPRLRVVTRDREAHDGRRHRHDPRVGMIGGSYGGAVQFATAAVDPRLDTIVPLITWNDLSYSLGPNGTDQLDDAAAGADAVSTRTPGATKLTWGLLFSTLGVVGGVQGAPDDPSRLLPCPNFADFVCPALVTAGTTGFFDDPSVEALRHASVADYVDRVRIPTLLMQGQADTLFNLNESVATYRALKRQGTPVRLVWQSWGHSDGEPAPGELDLDDLDPRTQYQARRVYDWFDHHLRGARGGQGPAFAYFRDWVPYDGIATPAYGTSRSVPTGTTRRLFLSDDDLVATSDAVVTGSQNLLTPPAGLPTSIDELDALGRFDAPPLPERDLPGTAVSWTTSPLTTPLDVVGIPRVTLEVDAPTAVGGAGPGTDLVLFLRLQDVAPDGTASAIRHLVAPVRIPGAGRPFEVDLPGIVHRFAPDHAVRLVVAGGSVNYRGGLVPTPVTIRTGGDAGGQVLTLPVTD